MKRFFDVFWRLMISAGVSFFIIALMIRLVSPDGDASQRASLIEVLLKISVPLVMIYLLCQLSQTFIRSERYRILIAAGGTDNVPGRFQMFLVTAARNMFVDMLPARLGELSYVGLLNRGYDVSGQRCLTSMSVSFLFDFLALLIIAGLVISMPLVTSDIRGIMLATLVVVGLLVILLALTLFVGVRWLVKLNRLVPQSFRKTSIFESWSLFIEKLAEAFEETRHAGVFWKTFFLSLGVRAFKYIGLYYAFLAVAIPSFSELATAPFSNVFFALLGAEASASLPIPTFMSFGAYEFGGLFALKLLGFSASGSMIAMLAIHIITQLIDYTIGGIGLVIFFLTSRYERLKSQYRSRLALAFSAVGVLVLFLGAGFLLSQYRGVKKLGSLTPPHSGKAQEVTPADQKAMEVFAANLKGFMVWSSNRYGNHDILMRTFPDLTTTRLTKHDNTETFPRISPDGQQMVFCRSQLPWVSQRDPVPWDVYLMNLRTGEERLLAKNGNTPTWAADGSKVYFQSNASEFVEHNLKTGTKRLLFASGHAAIPDETQLQTPDYNMYSEQLAVTLRVGRRETAIYSLDGSYIKVGGRSQCQLAWSRDYSFLYLIGSSPHGVYKFMPNTGETKLWLDLRGKFSHEYFPRQSNDGAYLALGSSIGGNEHEHDAADYEIFLWRVGSPHKDAVRFTHHTGNDNWPDLFLSP